MRVSASLLALTLALGGCQATYNTAVADIRVVAAKIDKAASAVFSGANAAYQWTEAELPQMCALARSAANVAVTVAELSGDTGLSDKGKTLVLKGAAGLSAAGNTAACIAAGNGIKPANITEGATQIVQAFVSIRAAVRGSTVSITAVGAAGG